MDKEIVIVPKWEFVMWDLEKDTEYSQSITGTLGKPIPNLERRYIERVGGTKIHSLDSGEIQTKWTTRWENSCSFTTMWEECSICGKKFNEREF